MKRMTTIFAGIALASTGVALPKPALAWSKAGHLTVCDYAYRTTTDAVRAKINMLLKADGEYRSFNYGCVEEDEFPRVHPDDHFINYPRTKVAVTDSVCPENATCILQAIERQMAILADKTKPAKVRAKALLGLGHWVGDIHQPLHISFADDRGGNYLLVSGVCGSGQKSNLHSVWDKCLVEKRVLGVNLSPDWAGFTVTYRAVNKLIPLTTTAEKTLWTSSDPWQWAAESYKITLKENTRYCDLNSARTLCSKPTAERISINNDYVSSNGDIAKTRLRMAGVRLAYLLEKALAN
jgi:S1/P1 Nuclease